MQECEENVDNIADKVNNADLSHILTLKGKKPINNPKTT